MLRKVSLSIIRSLALYTQQQVYVILDMLTACYIPVAVCTVLDSWWWTEKLTETCRVLLQK